MSFILDALKKSESERQRPVIPGLMDSGMARPRQRLPAWAIALCALLAVNLLVLMFVLVRSRVAAPPPQALGQPRTDAGTGEGGVPEGHFSPLGPPVYAPEIPATAAPEIPVTAAPAIPVTTAPASPPRATPVVPQPKLNTGRTSARSVPRRDPLLTNEDYKANDEEVLPSINELNLTGAQALPELHLDVHVFATDPADRFVYVNMRKYHEGATLQEGPSIERIRRDGVVMNYQGLRFLLPRQ